MQMCSIENLNLRMSTLGIRNPNFKTKKEDPTFILQYNCISNRFSSRTSFGLCPVVFTIQFTLTLAKQSKMSVPCAHCCLDPPVMLRGVYCPGVDHIHYAKIPFLFYYAAGQEEH